MVMEKLEVYIQRTKPDPYLLTHTNTNFKLFEDINVKLKTLKLLDEKTGTTNKDDRAS